MSLERIRRGDEEALSALLLETWVPLVRYLRSLSTTIDAAEDAAQEAFVRLWERRERWEAGTARGLLFRIGRNVVLDQRRRSEVRGRLRERIGESVQLRPSTPEDDLLALEAATAIGQALGELPDRQREIFELVRLHGLSYREVADALQISEQTVANQMSRALATLRSGLADLLGASEADRSASEAKDHG